MNRKIFFAISLLTLSINTLKAQETLKTQDIPQKQETPKKKERSREFYFSWGYNDESYTRSNIKIDQPALGNNFTFVDVIGHDHRGWDEDFFHLALSIPQYNYRLGLIIDKVKDWGVEINFDHTKFLFADQVAHIQGTLKGIPGRDTTVNFNYNNGYFYYLNNGANFLLFNLVKRWHWFRDKSGNIKVDILAKAGVGPVIPHVENGFFLNDSTFHEQKNDPHFQLGGWNIGIEGTIKVTFYKYVYLEFCNKVDYARYSNLKIYEGTAKQAFGTYEDILNLGVTFPVGKR
jgi:hypothetical protein